MENTSFVAAELTAEILSIGDELASGQRLDTNSQWISQQLMDLGIRVCFHTTVGDVFEDNLIALRTAASRTDVVVITGGLGPTADDLTREAMAEAFDLPLELREEALLHIEALFALRKRPMPERNRVQAMFPRSSAIIPNPHGTAPGIDLQVSVHDASQRLRTSRLFALPGVPAEMREMFSSSVQPSLIRGLGAGATRWRYHSMKVFGIGESDVEKLLPDLIARDREPRVGITVSKATITLRIAARCAEEEEFQSVIASTVEQVRGALGNLVFAEGELDLHHAVHRNLEASNVRLGVVEVGASNRIGQMLSTLQRSGGYGLRTARWLASTAELRAAADGLKCSLQDTDALTGSLAALAESMVATQELDACLAVGIYPTLEEVEQAALLPHADFTMCLARKKRPTKSNTITLGGHPEVLYHRLAKTALNFLRIESLRD